MTLSRLTHERYARMRDLGELPDDLSVESVAPHPEPPAVPVRGGASTHPNWPRVIALVRSVDGHRVDHDFVAEVPRLSDAMLLCSRYPYRAQVITKSSKRVFDNQKPMEVGDVRT